MKLEISLVCSQEGRRAELCFWDKQLWIETKSNSKAGNYQQQQLPYAKGVDECKRKKVRSILRLTNKK
jgi:hypothetical protein